MTIRNVAPKSTATMLGHYNYGQGQVYRKIAPECARSSAFLAKEAGVELVRFGREIDVRDGSKADSLHSTILCLLYPQKRRFKRLCGGEDL
jgi:hypothetical protein